MYMLSIKWISVTQKQYVTSLQHKLAVIYSMVDIKIDSHKNLDLYLL